MTLNITTVSVMMLNIITLTMPFAQHNEAKRNDAQHNHVLKKKFNDIATWSFQREPLHLQFYKN